MAQYTEAENAIAKARVKKDGACWYWQWSLTVYRGVPFILTIASPGETYYSKEESGGYRVGHTNPYYTPDYQAISDISRTESLAV